MISRKLEKIISTKTTGSIIIVTHSIGGVYALELFHRLMRITAFVGIEPTTREIINNPPKTRAYIDAAKKHDAMGQDGFIQYIHKKLFLYFPSQQANLIWQTAENSEKSASKFAIQYKNFSDSFDWHSHTRLSKIPSVIFTEKYRKEEYLRSEFMTDNQYSKVISLGDFHYIHWEEPIIIVEEIKEVIKNLI
ncbi:hypothetical protein [Oenococcus oeni]|uniref:hypothetical protein n=1 Tax=Oenococcus oeni TaxID=1247 RepID=UPI0009B556CE|nr:hypothetical protein [Oenococcus oeni]